jgi:putative ABC transport system permease protein
VFWLRWSWRDLKGRWVHVIAIALVIALGTGSYAGLSSVTRWRRLSTDEGYAALRMYDLRVALTANTQTPEGSLLNALGMLPDPAVVEEATERLLVPTQVDASLSGETIIVPGLVYGLDLTAGNAPVNALYLERGDWPTEGQPAVLLERNFARYYELPPSGEVVLGGDVKVSYTGHVLTPEYFLVTTEQGGLLAEANFAAVFTSLAGAQLLAGQPGSVNDLVLTLRPGADAQTVRRELQEALARALPQTPLRVMTRSDDPSFRLNDKDIKGDQQIYDIFAVLIFAGALGSSFNLATRIVEAQRREIGISMVLGVQPARIAIRPLLLGAQIALLGVLFGVVVGYVIGESLMTLVRELMPLPQWRTPFQVRLFAGVAVLGLILPVLAVAWPVWSAVRVTAIEAVRPAYRASRGTGLAPLVRRLPLPGGTLGRAPLRNVFRAPRRTLLTSLGIAAALAALIAFVGMIDSFLAATDRGEREILRGAPNRLDVRLAGFFPESSPALGQIISADTVFRSEAGALVPASISTAGTSIDIQLEFLDLGGELWRPSIIEGTAERAELGVYVSELAARDLDVAPGDNVELRLPVVRADGSVSTSQRSVEVLGIHAHPFRFVTYIDTSHLSLLGDERPVNLIKVVPREEYSLDEAKQELARLPFVTSIERPGDIATAIRDLLNQFVVVLRVVEGAMLLIALLIAFNAASINMDERAREHATMFAFGVPVRTVLQIAVIENLIIGAAATTFGLIGGGALLRVLIETRIAETLPDIYIKPVISTETLVLTIVLGVVAVALAPLLTWRRLASMDVPRTLKVVE